MARESEDPRQHKHREGVRRHSERDPEPEGRVRDRTSRRERSTEKTGRDELSERRTGRNDDANCEDLRRHEQRDGLKGRDERDLDVETGSKRERSTEKQRRDTPDKKISRNEDAGPGEHERHSSPKRGRSSKKSRRSPSSTEDDSDESDSDGGGRRRKHAKEEKKGAKRVEDADDEERNRNSSPKRGRSKKKHRSRSLSTEESSDESDSDGGGRRRKHVKDEKKKGSKDRSLEGRKRKDEDDDIHEESDGDQKGKPRKKKRSRRRKASVSGESEGASDDDSPSEDSDSPSDSEDERRRRKQRKKEKERRSGKDAKRERKRERERRRKEKKKERKERKKKEKEKLSKSSVTSQWGKYGIIKDIDMWNKRPEFSAWLSEVKKINLESMTNREERDMYKEYMEDYNTATLPSKKYYNIDAWHRGQMEKAAKKGIVVAEERTIFNDEDMRREEVRREREAQKERELKALMMQMKSGMAESMREQERLKGEMEYHYRVGNHEAAAAIQRRLAPDDPATAFRK